MPHLGKGGIPSTLARRSTIRWRGVRISVTPPPEFGVCPSPSWSPPAHTTEFPPSYHRGKGRHFEMEGHSLLIRGISHFEAARSHIKVQAGSRTSNFKVLHGCPIGCPHLGAPVATCGIGHTDTCMVLYVGICTPAWSGGRPFTRGTVCIVFEG